MYHRFLLLCMLVIASLCPAFARGAGQLVHALKRPNSDLPSPFLFSSDLFGAAIDVHQGIAIVGSPGKSDPNTPVNQAFLFDVATGALLRTFDDPTDDGEHNRFGESVSLSAGRVLIGEPGGIGEAHLFDLSTGALLHTIHDPSTTEFGEFGSAVELDGERALIGGFLTESTIAPGNSGNAYLFDAASGQLLRTINDPSPSGETGFFGVSVALNGDRLIVGEINEANDDPGAVYIFDSQTGALARTIENPTNQTSARFGLSVDAEGNRLLVGAPGHASTFEPGAEIPSPVVSLGRAYLFDITTGELTVTYSNPTPPIGTVLGSSGGIGGFNGVALDGERVLVADGRFNDDDSTAHLFDTVSGSLLETFFDGLPGGFSLFSDQRDRSVAIDANTVLAGVPNSGSGQVYVFTLDPVLSGPPGDYNNDGIVDAADYTVWRDALGEGGPLPNETESPGIVDIEDYEVFVANFGESNAAVEDIASSTEFVPEPANALLVLMSTCVLMTRHKRVAATR